MKNTVLTLTLMPSFLLAPIAGAFIRSRVNNSLRPKYVIVG